MPKSADSAAGGRMPASGRKPRRSQKPATLEQWAALDFEPWKRTKRDRPPTPASWRELWNPHGVSLRFAWEICHKTKPELTEIVRNTDEKTGRAFMKSYRSSVEFFKDMLKLLESAEARYISAGSVAELEWEREEREERKRA